METKGTPIFRLGQKVMVTQENFALDAMNRPTKDVTHKTLSSAHIVSIRYMVANRSVYDEEGKNTGTYELDFEGYVYHLDDQSIQKEDNIRPATQDEITQFFTAIGAE